MFNAAVGRKELSVSEMKSMVSAAFYAATSDSPTMDFSFARDAGINQALLSDLQKMRSRCRYELKQNGIAKGMPRIYANSVIGRGPRLSLEGGNPEWNKRAEKLFTRWARTADMMGGGSFGLQTHQGCRQLFSAGEYFLVPRTAKTGAIRLQYLSIRPDRVKTPTDVPTSTRIDNGVEVDADGIPIAYYILREDPDNASQTIQTTLESFDRVPVDKLIHVFYREEPVQHRGEPWMATSLPVWHKMRRYDEATIAAAIVAAKFAAVLVNLNQDAVADAATILPTTVLDIQDGQMMVPPPGYEPRQIDPKHPSQNSSEFRRDQIGAAGAATAMPVNIASQDSSKSNFSSARFDGVSFSQEGAVARELIETLHLNRVWQAWIAEAMAAGVVPAIDLNDIDTAPAVEWLWIEEVRHSDPAKQANAEETRLKSSTATVGQIVMEKGMDRQQFREALLEEVNWYRANGLTHPLDADSQGGGEAPFNGGNEDA
jgi:lambda family phage portal protein